MTLNGPNPDVYARRRARALDRLRENNALLLLPVVAPAVYSNDVHYAYRTSTNIRYLCGFEEPAALILSGCGVEDGLTLLVQPRDPDAETWTGRRAGVEGALSEYRADQAYTVDQLHTVIDRHLAGASTLYYAGGLDPAADQRVLDRIHAVNATRPRRGGEPIAVIDAGAVLDEMRIVKEDEEIELMRAACELSAQAHLDLMKSARSGMYEYQVEAMLEHAFRNGGCTGPAYGTIAAAGANATVLHYTRNDRCLENDDLLLVDAGGEYGGYCADITRTLPVATTFSSAQAELYDIVLAAQKAAIEAIGPGTTHEDVHGVAVRVLVQGMLDVGLLEGDADECIEAERYKPYYMHGTSHWLGMDVHDVGSYRSGSGSRTLETGMILTVEPGLYVSETSDAPEKYRGIGIRIEDDVLVTGSGFDVLTSGAPKERDEIETLRGAANAAG